MIKVLLDHRAPLVLKGLVDIPSRDHRVVMVKREKKEILVYQDLRVLVDLLADQEEMDQLDRGACLGRMDHKDSRVLQGPLAVLGPPGPLVEVDLLDPWETRDHLALLVPKETRVNGESCSLKLPSGP